MRPAPASLPQASAWFQDYGTASSAQWLDSELSLQSRRVRKCPTISPGGHDQHASAKRVLFFSAQHQMPCPNAYEKSPYHSLRPKKAKEKRMIALLPGFAN